MLKNIRSHDIFVGEEVKNNFLLQKANSIRNIHSYFNSRLKLEIIPEPKEVIIVSREWVKAFKAWLDR